MVGESRAKKELFVCLGVVGAVCVPSPSPSNHRRLLFRLFCLGLEAPSPALDSASASASLSCMSYRGSSCSEVGESWPYGEPSWPAALPAKALRLRPWPCIGDARALSFPMSDVACVFRSLPLASPSSASHDCCRELAAGGSEVNVADRANCTLFRSLGTSDPSPSVGCRDMGAKGG
jgi:hypothetical protein